MLRGFHYYKIFFLPVVLVSFTESMHSFSPANLIDKLNKVFSRIETNCWEPVPTFKNPFQLSLYNKNNIRNNWEANGFLGIAKDKKQFFSKASRHRNIQAKKRTEYALERIKTGIMF